MTLSFAVCSFRTTTTTTTVPFSCIVVGAGVSAADKQRGRNEGTGKHERERNGEYGNWRPLKASRGGVYLRRSERSDKWCGGAFVGHRRLCGWLALSRLSFVLSPFPLLPLCRVFSTTAISQDLIYRLYRDIVAIYPG